MPWGGWQQAINLMQPFQVWGNALQPLQMIQSAVMLELASGIILWIGPFTISIKWGCNVIKNEICTPETNIILDVNCNWKIKNYEMMELNLQKSSCGCFIIDFLLNWKFISWLILLYCSSLVRRGTFLSFYLLLILPQGYFFTNDF